MSIAGSLASAVAAGRAQGFDTIQIFLKNQRQWAAGRLGRAEAGAFRAAQARSGIDPVVAHASYLPNLASPRTALRERSVRALAVEVKRAGRLGIPILVLHPGSHGGAGVEAGVERIARGLDRVFRAAGDATVRIALETTAGQGASVGHRFEHLRSIVDASGHPERLAVCFDTCHAFAAGYDLRTAASWRATFEAFDRIVGLDRLALFHVNDALLPLGSRRDRHAHIGEGRIGDEGFRLLLRDERFRSLPKILETPKQRDGVAMDPVNAARLRRLAGEETA